MPQYALVNSNGNVVNVALWDGTSPWQPPPGLVPVPASAPGVGTGWTYANGVFTPPAPSAPSISPPPPTCQLWQLQAVMTPAQWSAAQAAIASMNNPAVTAFMQHGTNMIPATSTTLMQLGQTIGLSPDQVTALVQQASQVSIP